MCKKILFSIQIFLIFSCSKNIEVLKPQYSNVYTYRFSSSLVLNKNYYVSESFGFKDFMLFSFSQDVFVQKIEIEQVLEKKYDEIKQITVYTNNGLAGSFACEKININQKISYCLIIFDSTQNQHSTNFYSPSFNISLFYRKMNKPIAIKDIRFFENDSTQLQMSCIRNSVLKNKVFDKYTSKIVNKTTNYRSFFSGKYGIAVFCEGFNSDTFYVSFNKKNKFMLKRFVFFQYKSKIDTLDFSIKQKNNEIEIVKIGKFYSDVADSMLVDLATLDTNFIIDIKYATANNFTGKKLYKCAKALLRYCPAKDLLLSQQELISKGFRIKIFDAYRPLSAQYVLWEAMPNINYVAPPQKGSIHNRGAAIDVTLTDLLGNELNMGTPYDFFGIEAFSDNLNFSDDILQNRQLLHSTVQKYNFIPIRTEWWHLSHRTALLYPIEDISLPCD